LDIFFLGKDFYIQFKRIYQEDQEIGRLWLQG